MIFIGTSGYSYKDWIGPFYPKGTKAGEMLPYYAQHFPAVEINATYYNVFSPATFASMDERTPADFRFSIKAPGTVTHVPKTGALVLHGDVHLFRENVQPLVSSGKVAAALLQFPNSFKPGERSYEYLRRLADAWHDLPLVAEFRNRDWQTPHTLEMLRELRMGFCNVDQPQFTSLLRPSADVTGMVGYVRFHGRNYKAWWSGDNTTRYDYLYTGQELEPWAQRLTEVEAQGVKETLAFFNNHRGGQAVQNAGTLTGLLRERFGNRAAAIVEKI